jgi:hypothetical protein
VKEVVVDSDNSIIPLLEVEGFEIGLDWQRRERK